MSQFLISSFVPILALTLGVLAPAYAAVLDQSLIGSWDFIGFSDGGVDAVTTGTAVFGEDSTFSIVGTVTYPGEPTDSVAVNGTYLQTGDTVVLTIEQISLEWTLLFTEPIVVLTEVEPPPANTITLRRQPTPADPLSWGRLKAGYR